MWTIGGTRISSILTEIIRSTKCLAIICTVCKEISKLPGVLSCNTTYTLFPEEEIFGLKETSVLFLRFIVSDVWLALKKTSKLLGVKSCHTTYAFEALTTPEDPGGPCVPLNPLGPCGPGPVLSAPAGPGGPAGALWAYFIIFLLSSLNLNLQNSTELTKNPSNGPVLHSYFLSSVGYVL